MTAIGHVVFGPAIAEGAFFSGTPVYTSLFDADNSVAIITSVPEDGTITDVGFYIYQIVGNPPAYNVGLVTISGGFPTSTAYGGSSTEIVDYTVSGWIWTPLTTPATGNRGDVASVRIWPTGTAPDVSNHVRVAADNLIYLNFPTYARFTTSWSTLQGPPPIAFKYNTGKIVGYPILNGSSNYINSSTTPDEVGCRFTVPVEMKCSGIRFMMEEDFYTDSEYQVILYDSVSNVLGSATINSKSTYSYALTDIFLDTEVQLATGSFYRVSVKPLSTNNIRIMTAEFPSSTERNCSIPESSRWYGTSRTDSGSWTDNQTSLPWMALIISDISSGGGTGGGTSEWGYVG